MADNKERVEKTFIPDASEVDRMNEMLKESYRTDGMTMPRINLGTPTDAEAELSQARRNYILEPDKYADSKLPNSDTTFAELNEESKHGIMDNTDDLIRHSVEIKTLEGGKDVVVYSTSDGKSVLGGVSSTVTAKDLESTDIEANKPVNNTEDSKEKPKQVETILDTSPLRTDYKSTEKKVENNKSNEPPKPIE